MTNLVKISDLSSKYDITARTLRYYEDMGLLESFRGDDYAYRMYDEEAIKRLEQILVLRKMSISIRDIKRVFDSPGTEVVLEVLAKKVTSIDDELALLHELRSIVQDFIHEIEKLTFSKDSDVKQLYSKAREIEDQLASVDQGEKSASVHRLMEIADKLDKKIPDIMVVNIPPFRAITTKEQTWEELFQPGGYMFQLWQLEGIYKEIIFDCFDFLLFKGDKAEWICAIKDHVRQADVGDFSIIDYPGGLYAMAVSIDEDDESLQRVEDKVKRWIDQTNFELDESRSIMFNMPYLYEPGRNNVYEEIEKGLGYKQMQRYFPIKLKDKLY